MLLAGPALAHIGPDNLNNNAGGGFMLSAIIERFLLFVNALPGVIS
jgi:hypothetical protein